jgi:hypothetical protein
MNRWLTAFAVAPLALSAGCLSPSTPPAMTPVASAQPTPDAGVVVFVRPTDPCDGSDFTTVVDERGRFVANVAPGTSAAVPALPGRRVFYAWSSFDYRDEAHPEFNPVSAARVGVSPGETSYVGLLVRQRNSSVTRCGHWILVDLLPVGPRSPMWSDLQGWLASTKLHVADAAQGQAALDRNPAMLASEIELGQAKMRIIDAALLAARRREAERSAGSR